MGAMKSRWSFLRRPGFWIGLLMLMALVLWLGVAKVDEVAEARFSGTGRVLDQEGKPLAGVRVALTLWPPDPADPVLIEDLFQRRSFLWPRDEGGSPWVSDTRGIFTVRERARYGLRYHTFLGIWPTHHNPFTKGWLVLCGPGGETRIKELDLSGWRFAGWEFEKPAEPIPELNVDLGGTGEA